MTFIECTNNKYIIDDSCGDEKPLVEAFASLISKKGFDNFSVVCGVNASPDFGYLELGDRFWRASLSIYFMGSTGGFVERGCGYVEPWLFNARHAIELYVKGFLFYSFWLKELQKDTLTKGEINKVHNLKQKLGILHDIYGLYESYEKEIEDLIRTWNTKELSDPPDMSMLLLREDHKNSLNELDQADKSSFRFRYPSFSENIQSKNVKKSTIDTLHEIGWGHDKTELLPNIGLPSKAGYFFDHLTVINNIHALMKGLNSIASYLNSYWSYIDERQNYEKEIMRQYYYDV